MRYIKEAQTRAKRRKNAWNFLLIPAVVIPLVGIWALSVFGAEWLHMSKYPNQSLKSGTGVGTILITVSPFFGTLPLAMIVGNVFVWLIPPARHALDAEAKSVPNTNFLSAQKQLLKIVYIVLPISIAATILGAIIPW